MTLDTETVRVPNIGNVIYDIAWISHNKKGDYGQVHNYLVAEVWLDAKLMQTAYYVDKIPLYLKMLSQNKISVKSWNEICTLLATTIYTDKCQVMQAYNIKFDILAMQSTNYYINNIKGRKASQLVQQIVKAPIKFCDIYSVACQTILQNKGYHKFATDNNLITECGNIKANAESAFAYITSNPQHVESHTALSDVQEEIAIYARSRRQHKSFKTFIHQPWKLIQEGQIC